MTTADLIMFGVVIGVGVPAAVRCPAPLILLGWWSAGMAVWAVTQEAPSVLLSFVLDAVAMALILRFRWSAWDTIVALLFVPTWAAYFALDGKSLWWAVWGIGLAQFILAGIGSIPWSTERLIRDRVEERRRQFDDIFRKLQLAWRFR